jgi:hypothetical protein
MPDLVIEIDLDIEDGKLFFKKFFCAFGPCLQGFRDGCKSYLSVDSTALNGRWNGYLPAATSVDMDTTGCSMLLMVFLVRVKGK